MSVISEPTPFYKRTSFQFALVMIVSFFIGGLLGHVTRDALRNDTVSCPSGASFDTNHNRCLKDKLSYDCMVNNIDCPPGRGEAHQPVQDNKQGPTTGAPPCYLQISDLDHYKNGMPFNKKGQRLMNLPEEVGGFAIENGCGKTPDPRWTSPSSP